MLVGLEQFGIQPGPLLFEKNPTLVWGVIASLYIGNVMLLVLNLPLIGIWVRLLKIPIPWLYAGIVIFACLGSYGLSGNPFDLLMLWIIGTVGLGMRIVGIPVLPCIIGLVLGPLLEQYLRRALAISQGDWSVFFTHPLSCALLIVSALLLLGSPTLRWIEQRKLKPA
jgi:putative tricarboxylic transport membrane protein